MIALDPLIDQTLGESSQIRYHSPVLQRAVDGLITALSGWRAVANHVIRLSRNQAQAEAAAVLQHLAPALQSLPDESEPTRWMADPAGLQKACEATSRRLDVFPAATPSERLLADKVAEALAGMSHALSGLRLLIADPARPVPRRGFVSLRVPDWLPALINAGRAVVTIGAVSLFWIVTAWPSGATAITWAAITIILLSPRADQAYAAAVSFTAGNALAATFAAILAFAVLPQLQTFAGLSIALGAYLVPVGALMAQPWQAALFTPMVANMVPLLAPANQMSYDTVQFYNATLGLVAGNIAAVLAFRLLPPLSPAFRARRLLALTMHDLRRLARGHRDWDWQGHLRGRLSAMPEEATPLQRAQLLAALSAGTEISQLRHITRWLGLSAGLDPALAAIAHGNSRLATMCLGQLDGALTARAGSGPEMQTGLRGRASIVALSEILAQHAAYFDAGARE